MCNWEAADKAMEEIPGHDGRLCSCMKALSLSELTEILHTHVDFKNSNYKLKSKNQELQEMCQKHFSEYKLKLCGHRRN